MNQIDLSGRNAVVTGGASGIGYAIAQRLLAEDNDYLLADNFLRAIEEDSPSILDVRTSRNITAMVAAAIESGRSGKVVEVG